MLANTAVGVWRPGDTLSGDLSVRVGEFAFQYHIAVDQTAFKQQQTINQNAMGSGATRRAVGGPVRAGAPYIVGELGPELFFPTVPGSVFTTGDSRKIIEQAQTKAYTTAGQFGAAPNVAAFQRLDSAASGVNGNVLQEAQSLATIAIKDLTKATDSASSSADGLGGALNGAGDAATTEVTKTIAEIDKVSEAWKAFVKTLTESQATELVKNVADAAKALTDSFSEDQTKKYQALIADQAIVAAQTITDTLKASLNPEQLAAYNDAMALAQKQLDAATSSFTSSLDPQQMALYQKSIADAAAKAAKDAADAAAKAAKDIADAADAAAREAADAAARAAQATDDIIAKAAQDAADITVNSASNAAAATTESDDVIAAAAAKLALDLEQLAKDVAVSFDAASQRLAGEVEAEQKRVLDGQKANVDEFGRQIFDWVKELKGKTGPEIDKVASDFRILAGQTGNMHFLALADEVEAARSKIPGTIQNLAASITGNGGVPGLIGSVELATLQIASWVR